MKKFLTITLSGGLIGACGLESKSSQTSSVDEPMQEVIIENLTKFIKAHDKKNPVICSGFSSTSNGKEYLLSLDSSAEARGKYFLNFHPFEGENFTYEIDFNKASVRSPSDIFINTMVELYYPESANSYELIVTIFSEESKEDILGVNTMYQSLECI